MDSDTKMTEAPNSRLLDPKIFEYLKTKIDEDQQVRDALSQIIQRLDRANSHVQGLLSRVHATPRSQCELPSLLSASFILCPRSLSLPNLSVIRP